jgi:ABC-type transporter Mla subunit MlaD
MLAWIERRLFSQLRRDIADVATRLDAVAQRLEHLSRQVADAQAVVEATAARAAVSTEQTLGVVESEARTARRFDEIERMLGAAPPGPR